MFCDIHNADERVLLVNLDAQVDRQPGELDVLKRFVQGVKERPWSSNWEQPTGFITDHNNGRPLKTRQRSLPL
jgi:hypothetical protein